MKENTKEENQEARSPAEETAPADAKAAQTAAPPAESETGEPGEAENRLREMEEELKKKDAELQKQKELLLRTAAEYDNFRKRTEKEKSAIYSDATSAAVLEFLPVADNLSRALELRECTAEDLRKGVEMVQKQMQAALDKLGVTEMGQEGEAFDPELHNAVSHVEDENAGENTITQVFQKGYSLGGKVVRHAMVQVAN